MNRRGFGALLAAGLLIPAVCAVAAITQPELGHELHPVEPPQAAPVFSLADMDGEEHALADYRGKVVMLNFWATWCPPCRREMPSMEAVYRKFADQGFVVLAVNEWEDADHVFAYMGQLSVFPTFPVLFDASGEVAEAYGIKGLPTTVLIDRQGRVVFRAVGGRDFNHPDVEALIRGLLE